MKDFLVFCDQNPIKDNIIKHQFFTPILIDSLLEKGLENILVFEEKNMFNNNISEFINYSNSDCKNAYKIVKAKVFEKLLKENKLIF